MDKNVYHCTTQKTASQWFRMFYSDPLFYKYSGLTASDFRRKEPKQTGYIFVPLYANYDAYLIWEKPDNHLAYFVIRDPRDITVSWYFSIRYSHSVMGDVIPKYRPMFNKMSVKDGLVKSIDFLHNGGYYKRLKSWVDNAPDIVYRYEDFTANSIDFMRRLMRFMDIAMPNEVLQILCNKYSFRRLSGRRKGVEDNKRQYRKGIAGDYKNYFDTELLDYFNKITDNIAEALNYKGEDN